MTLSFMEKWSKAGDPTYFVVKIWASFIEQVQRNMRSVGQVQIEVEGRKINGTAFHMRDIMKARKATAEMYEYLEQYKDKFDREVDQPPANELIVPKRHTIREDPSDRWKVGMKIHFVVKNRTPDRFQFAPIMEVSAIQKLRIRWHGDEDSMMGRAADVFIDDQQVNGTELMDQLAIYDGFSGLPAFLRYFNEDFDGKIIHWTDHRYELNKEEENA